MSVLHQPQQHLTTAWENFTQRTSLAKELSFKLENLLTFLYKNLTFYCETVTSTDGILLFNYFFFHWLFSLRSPATWFCTVFSEQRNLNRAHQQPPPHPSLIPQQCHDGHFASFTCFRCQLSPVWGEMLNTGNVRLHITWAWRLQSHKPKLAKHNALETRKAATNYIFSLNRKHLWEIWFVWNGFRKSLKFSCLHKSAGWHCLPPVSRVQTFPHDNSAAQSKRENPSTAHNKKTKDEQRKTFVRQISWHLLLLSQHTETVGYHCTGPFESLEQHFARLDQEMERQIYVC